MSICLAILVKNAERDIVRCITSARPLIDRWVIIDTGSTDNTKTIVKDALSDVPGRLLEREWRGFADNRTELLHEARQSGADYTLMLDADLELVIDGNVPALTYDEYYLTVHDRGMEYALPLLTSTRREFFYGGVAHAALMCKEQINGAGNLRMIRVIDHGGGPGTDGKFERDRDNLAAEVVKHPNDARSWFYLAQSYRDLDQIDEAIECYKHRAAMGGWDEEVYYALYQAGLLLCAHRSYAEGAPLLLEAWKLRPSRAEALRALAGCTTSVANKIPFPESDLLFVEPDAYAPPGPLRAVPAAKAAA